jgi:hypothetical protein
MKVEYIKSFYSDDLKKVASISRDEYHWVVDLYENDKKVETRLITDHTLEYAEDLAENFVFGYGEFGQFL